MTARSTETANASLARDLLYAAHYYLANRRGILILAIIAIVAGTAFNWSWLVATGIAPILLTALPCAVMFGGSCSTHASQSHEAAGRTSEHARPLIHSATTGSAPTCCQASTEIPAPPAAKQAEPSEARSGS